MAKDTNELNPIVEWLLKGSLIGGGVASTSALISQVLEAKRQKKLKDERDKGEITPNTIVLRIKKKAECNRAKKNCTNKATKEAKKAKVKVSPTVEAKDIMYSASDKPRGMNGQFTSIRTKEASITEKAFSILSFGTGAVGGYYLVDKLASKLEQNRLKKQIEAAQTEYIDLLDGKIVKGAESFSELFMFNNHEFDDFEKEVETNIQKEAGLTTDVYDAIKKGPNLLKKIPKFVINGAENATSTLLAAYILGIGGSAYLTKKLLEKHFKDANEQVEPEKQTKIIFKSASSEFEIQPEEMLATVIVMRDCIADSTPPHIKTAWFGQKLLDKILEPSIDNYTTELSKTPEGRDWIFKFWLADNNFIDPAVLANTPPPIEQSRNAIYGRAKAYIQNNMGRFSDKIKSTVLRNMQANPEEWFKMIGSAENKQYLDAIIDRQIDAFANANNSGFSGFMMKIPIIGDWIRKLISWYYKNTSSGRKSIANKAMGFFTQGGSPLRAQNILQNYDFSGNNGSYWSPKGNIPQTEPVTPQTIEDSKATTPTAEQTPIAPPTHQTQKVVPTPQATPTVTAPQEVPAP